MSVWTMDGCINGCGCEWLAEQWMWKGWTDTWMLMNGWTSGCGSVGGSVSG